MTREEAINFGEMFLEVNKDSKNSSTYEFIDKALKLLKQEPCEDVISRQAVINAIDKWVKNRHILMTLPPNEVTPLFESIHELPPSIRKSQREYKDKCETCKHEYCYRSVDEMNAAHESGESELPWYMEIFDTDKINKYMERMKKERSDTE